MHDSVAVFHLKYNYYYSHSWESTIILVWITTANIALPTDYQFAKEILLMKCLIFGNLFSIKQASKIGIIIPCFNYAHCNMHESLIFFYS